MSQTSISRQVQIGFLGLFLVVALAGAVSTWSAIRLAKTGQMVGNKLSPMVAESLHAKQRVTEAHILVEEIMGGDTAESPDEVWKRLGEAGTALSTLGAGIDQRLGADSEKAIRAQIGKARDLLDALRAQAEGRFALLETAQGVGSGADEEFDGLYDSIREHLTSLAETGAGNADVQHHIGKALYLVAHGHLMTEEVLGGDVSEDIGEALDAFGASGAAVAQAAAAIGSALPGDAVATVGAEITRLSELALQRAAAAREKADKIEQAEIDFDAAYHAYIDAADAMASLIRVEMTRGLATLKSVEEIALFFAVGSLAIVAGLAVFAFRRVSSRIVIRLKDVDTAMRGLTAGNLDTKVPAWTSADELGSLRETVVHFRQSLVERARLERESAASDERAVEEARKRSEAEEQSRTAELQRAREQQSREEAARSRDTAAAAEIARVVNACASGDFSQSLRTDDKDGVFREVCEGLNRIGEVTNGTLGDIRQALEALAKGDLIFRVKGDQQGVFHEIVNAANACASSLEETIRGIGTSGEAVGASSQEIANASSDLARRSERSAATLEETAAAIEEIAASIRSADTAASDANRDVAEIDAKAVAGTAVVSQAVEAMGEIEASSSAISKIIQVMDGIAFQTNLLALNAGVEAARAGDAGRGFAVVASEVRALAQRSSEASSEIAALIEQSGRQVRSGVDLVNQTGQALNEIAVAIRNVAEKINGIANATRETSSGIGEISNAASELDRTTQQNAAMFEETTAAVKVLQDEAQSLSGAVSSFRLSNELGSSSASKRVA